MKDILILLLVVLSIVIWNNAVEVFNEKEETDFTPLINAELFMIVFSILSWNIWFALIVPVVVLFFTVCWFIFKYTVLFGEMVNELVKAILGTKIKVLDIKRKQLKDGE